MLLALWVACGMVGCFLELRIYTSGRHPQADAIQWMAREEHWGLLLAAVLLAAICGPVYLAAAVAGYWRTEPPEE